MHYLPELMGPLQRRAAAETSVLLGQFAGDRLVVSVAESLYFQENARAVCAFMGKGYVKKGLHF